MTRIAAHTAVNDNFPGSVSSHHENDLAKRLSLNGVWEIAIDGQQGQVNVPGAWEIQGYPSAVKRADYRKSVLIPVEWSQSNIRLCFGALSYEVEAFVNGVLVGHNLGMWHPFDFDITSAVRFGTVNEITLVITKPGPGDESWNYHDVLVGFIPYVAETFGGPWQEVWLMANHGPTLTDIRLAPEGSAQERGPSTLKVSTSIHDAPGMLWASAEILEASGQVIASTFVEVTESTITFQIPELDITCWSPSSPTLYRLRLRLLDDDRVVCETSRVFGFRKLSSEVNQVFINAEPLTIRGVLSWGWDPSTLAPTPTDAQIRDEFRRVRALGFNMIKLCLFVPPPRYFEIADEEGMLIWLEMPMWLPRLSAQFSAQTQAEYAAIFARVHHHPSIVIYSLGCELGADMADETLLGALNGLARQALTGVLICDNSGSGEAYRGLTFDFADFADYHFYADLHHFRPLLDHFQRDWRPARPLLFGEFCDCDDFRDTTALEGDPTYPYWKPLYGIEGSPDRWAYPEQDDLVARINLPVSSRELVQISYRQSLVVRKYILEHIRSRHEIAGYIVTGLRDTPISTSGMFDDLGRPKYDANTFRCFNADSILLLETGRTRAWVHGGDRIAPIDSHNHWSGSPISHRILYCGADQAGGSLDWSLVDAAGNILLQDSLTIDAQGRGDARQIGRLEWTAPSVTHAQRFTLTVHFGSIKNSWPMWVYPQPKTPCTSLLIYDPGGQLEPISQGLSSSIHFAEAASDADSVLITSVYTESIEAQVRSGRRAILLVNGGPYTKPVPFWREAIKLMFDHPLLEELAHHGYADMQFYHLAPDHALDVLRFKPDSVRPLIRRLDARLFTTLDYLVEMKIGAGTMIASTLNLCNGVGDQVRGFEANTAGQYLLDRMIAYMQKG